jgi:hypothetical protein
MSESPETGGPMVCLTSWPYDDVQESRRKATDLFERLRPALTESQPAKAFPFDGPHDVALIDAGEWWMVAVSGLPDKSGTLGKLDEWFDAYGGTESPTANEFQSDDGGNLTAFATSRGMGSVVETLTLTPAGEVVRA